MTTENALSDESISFLKYTLVGIFKMVMTLTLLWWLIDKLDVKYKTLTRVLILLLVFLLTHGAYKKIGYAK